VKLLLKYRSKALVATLIVVLFFAFRLPNLTLQPIFADEAIYIRWAQVMRAEPTLRFLPLSDGKTPLFMWLMIPLFKVFEDPLFAGRFLSIMAGLFTLVGVYLLGKKVFSETIGIWAAFLYAIVPYTVFFDRMALVDSMLAAFTIWIIYLTIWLVELKRLDLAMFLGFFLGGAILTKTPALINLVLLPMSLLVFNFKSKKIEYLKLFALWFVAIFIATVIYNILRLGPNFHMLSARNSDYVFPISRLLSSPLDPFIPHLKQYGDWLIKMMTIPVLIFLITGTWVVIKKMNRLGIVILLWVTIPLGIFMSLLQTFTARYLLFTIPIFLIIAGFGINNFLNRIADKRKVMVVILVATLLATPLYFNYYLLTDPAKAPLPADERRGYLEDWTAGYGLKEIASFLINEKKQGSIVVGTEGYFGTLPEGLQIYLDKSGIPIIGGQATVSAQVREAAIENKAYFVGNKNRLPARLENAKFIKEYTKAVPRADYPQDAIVLYQIFP
jgi:4-amino-4-deoxy-L-arabinose transferase-like glycosyltransferase